MEIREKVLYSSALHLRPFTFFEQIFSSHATCCFPKQQQIARWWDGNRFFIGVQKLFSLPAFRKFYFLFCKEAGLGNTTCPHFRQCRNFWNFWFFSAHFSKLLFSFDFLRLSNKFTPFGAALGQLMLVFITRLHYSALEHFRASRVVKYRCQSNSVCLFRFHSPRSKSLHFVSFLSSFDSW